MNAFLAHLDRVADDLREYVSGAGTWHQKKFGPCDSPVIAYFSMEFGLPSGTSNLILVATAKRVFAISPKNAKALVQTFARATELGSLAQTEAVSVYPSFILTQAWESPPARFLWISGLFLNIGLVVWVGLFIPLLQQIPFGFDSYGIVLDIVPSTRLILLPLVSASMFLGGWGAGLYFYRRDQQRPLAFITWISSTLTSLLFLMAVLFLVTTRI